MFCGGGSAGHVIPNIALIRELEGSYICEYMGTDGIERDICRRETVKFYRFDAVKLIRGKIIANLAIPFRLIKSVKQARAILLKARPDLLFCKGGYAALPPAIAARRLGIPVIAHESDLSPGIANRITSLFAEVTLTSFPETAEKFRRGLYAGAPVRREITCGNRAKAMEKFGLDARQTVIIFGGGSGSAAINDCVRITAADICRDYNIIHICGKGNLRTADIYGYVQLEYTQDMASVYACADCAVARCGSNSAFELMANKIPTLFIPLENRRSRGDQAENAQYFYKSGLCRVLKQSLLTAEKLQEEIRATMGDRKLKKALSSYSFESGNTRIKAEIVRYAEGNDAKARSRACKAVPDS